MQAKKYFAFSVYALVVFPALLFSPFTKNNFILKETAFVLFGVAAIACWLAAFLPRVPRGPADKIKYAALLLGIYLASIPLSGLNARHGALVFETFVLQFLLGACFALGAFLTAREQNRAIALLAGAFAITGVYGIVQFLGVDPVHWRAFGGRPSSFLGNPNFFAGYLVVCLPVILARALEARNFATRSLWWAAFALGTTNLYLTRTRGAWIAFAASMLFFCALRASADKRWRMIFALITLSALIAGFFARGELVRAFNSADRSVVERVFKWQTAFEMIKAHPVIGVGAGNLKVNFALYQAKIKGLAKFKLRGTSESNVHNEYFQIWAEQGTFGLAAYLLFFLYYFYLFIPRGKTTLDTGLGAGVAAFLVFSLSNFPLRIEPTAIAAFLFAGFSIHGREDAEYASAEKFYIIKNRAARFGALALVCAGAVYLAGAWAIPKLRAEVYRARGDNAAAAGMAQDALLRYEKAVALDYAHSERTAYDLAEIYRGLGLIDKALASYRIAVDLRNYGEVYHNIGNCYYLKKDTAEALKYWKLARELGLPGENDQRNLEKNIITLERGTGDGKN